MKTRLELRDPRGDKFWEIETTAGMRTTVWGRVGAARPERKTEFHESPREGREAVERAIAEKLAKGYVVVSREEPEPADAPSKLDLAPPAHDPDANVFAIVLSAGRDPMNRAPLCALLANASLGAGDGGGNVWLWHIAPAGGSWASCIDHETFDLFGFYAEPVLLAIWNGEQVSSEYRYDEDALDAVYAEEAPDVTPTMRDAARAELERLWNRGRALGACLYGEQVVAESVPPADERERMHPRFADTPGYVLYALLRALVAGNDADIAALTSLARTSTLRVVRDAAALIENGVAGAGIDLAAARAALRGG